MASRTDRRTDMQRNRPTGRETDRQRDIRAETALALTSLILNQLSPVGRSFSCRVSPSGKSRVKWRKTHWRCQQQVEGPIADRLKRCCLVTWIVRVQASASFEAVSVCRDFHQVLNTRLVAPSIGTCIHTYARKYIRTHTYLQPYMHVTKRCTRNRD